MQDTKTDVKKFFRKIVEEQDKYDALKPSDRCDRCPQPAASRLFFEPTETAQLPTVMLCPSHLKEHREALAQSEITGGYIEKSSLWWWEKIMGDQAGVVSKHK